MKKVMALTGIRSEYDLFFPLLKKLDESSDFDLQVIVSGAHLSPLHDYSVRQIEADGFKIASRIESLIYSNTESAKVNGIGNMISHLSMVLSDHEPDLLMVLGDREEVLAGSMVSVYMGVPVVHIAGGDNTCPIDGDVDEEVRHAASKLSHVHLTMADAHSERLIKMGEEDWRVHTIGNAGLDKVRLTPVIEQAELAKEVGEAANKDYCVFIYHVMSSYSQEQVFTEVDNSLKVAIENDLIIFIGAPNSDPGFEWVLEIYRQYENHPQVIFYRNLSRDLFVNLLRYAKCLLGNSSLGILEAGYMGLSVINVGERQRGRLANVNVQFVDESYEAISSAMNKVLNDNAYIDSVKKGSHLYGDGFAAEKAMRVLSQLPDKAKLIAKKLTY